MVVKRENHERVEVPKSAVTKLQEELTQQRIMTQTATEENINIKKELEDLKERLNTITEPRRESDEAMNRLFEDPRSKNLLPP